MCSQEDLRSCTFPTPPKSVRHWMCHKNISRKKCAHEQSVLVRTSGLFRFHFNHHPKDKLQPCGHTTETVVVWCGISALICFLPVALETGARSAGGMRMLDRQTFSPCCPLGNPMNSSIPVEGGGPAGPGSPTFPY